MIEVKIPKEIRNFKSKVLFNLTLRQILSLLIGVGISIPTYIFGKKIIGEELASWFVMLISAPCFLIGFIKKNGMNYEKYFYIMLKFNFLTPRIRKYKVENIIIYLLNKDNIKSKKNQKIKR